MPILQEEWKPIFDRDGIKNMVFSCQPVVSFIF
jgi:hypothetical protein